MKGKEILKFMKKIKKISLLFASVALLGVTLFSGNNEVKVNAEGETAYKELTFPDDNKDNNKVNNYTSEWEAKIGEDTYKIANASNYNWNKWTYIRFGSKAGKSVGTIISPVFEKAVKKIELTIDDITASNVNAITISTADSTTATDYDWSKPIDFKLEAGTQSVTLPSPAQSKSYKITVDCNKGGTNGFVQISKVAFFEDTEIDLTNYENITNLIKDIGTVEYSEVCKAKIKKARDAYNAAISDVQKQVENATENNLSTLIAAETEFSRLEAIAKEKVNNVSNSINNISPNVDSESLKQNYKAILNANRSFNDLTYDEKSLIDTSLISKLNSLVSALNSYATSFTMVEKGQLLNGAIASDSSKIKKGDDYYGVYGGNSVILKNISTSIDELEINYSITVAKLGRHNSSRHSLYLGAYNSKNELVSNKIVMETPATGDYKFNGTLILNKGITDFALKLVSTTESTENQLVSIKDVSFSYVAFDSVAKFIEDWAALRAKGGDQGICYYLTKETRAELDVMISRYSKFTGEDKSEIDNTSDGGTTIANTIEYVSSLLAKLDNTTPSKEESGLIISSINNHDKSSLIALFVVLGIITISGYFIIEKKKSIR